MTGEDRGVKATPEPATPERLRLLGALDLSFARKILNVNQNWIRIFDPIAIFGPHGQY
jgi:hypothetical protein